MHPASCTPPLSNWYLTRPASCASPLSNWFREAKKNPVPFGTGFVED